MKCPKCPDATLLMTDRQGVEIDYCPLCRGVWLDRGELDKLIERSALPETPQPTPAGHMRQPDFEDSDYRNSRGNGSGYGRGYTREQRRKKSWLSEIFD